MNPLFPVILKGFTQRAEDALPPSFKGCNLDARPGRLLTDGEDLKPLPFPGVGLPNFKATDVLETLVALCSWRAEQVGVLEASSLRERDKVAGNPRRGRFCHARLGPLSARKSRKPLTAVVRKGVFSLPGLHFESEVHNVK